MPLHSLKVLCILPVEDSDLEAIARAAPSITYLAVQGDAHQSGVTDVGVSRLARGCPELERLQLGHVACTGRAVEAVMRSCKRLQDLQLFIAHEHHEDAHRACSKHLSADRYFEAAFSSGERCCELCYFKQCRCCFL